MKNFILAILITMILTVACYARVFQQLEDGSYVTEAGIKTELDINAEAVKAQEDYDDTIAYCENRIAEKRAILDGANVTKDEVDVIKLMVAQELEVRQSTAPLAVDEYIYN